MDKLQAYLKSELDALREKGIFNRPRVLETEQKATVTIDGHEVITLSLNNYLGLTIHPRLLEAAIKAIEKYGVGSGSVRTIDGIRLCKSPRKIYPHKDMVGLRRVLEESRGANKVMVVTDGVFSMDGDIAPLPEIVELAEEFGAFVMVDDAHSSGVLGKN